jgi:hypothetical protein
VPVPSWEKLTYLQLERIPLHDVYLGSTEFPVLHTLDVSTYAALPKQFLARAPGAITTPTVTDTLRVLRVCRFVATNIQILRPGLVLIPSSPPRSVFATTF